MTDVVWGGRFSAQPDPTMFDLTASIGFDITLLDEDLRATTAHARVLEAAGILSADEVESIRSCALLISQRAAAGELDLTGHEDIHSLVESSLTEALGDAGKRIHAGRSRNDLVACDLRLWCLSSATALVDSTNELIQTVVELGKEHVTTVMPGYTHLQRAQPISLAFHLAAHGFAFLRDAERFNAARSAADVSVLGAGALAGNTLGLDAQIAADELGFSSVFDNAMDAVSDRDFACDLAYASALCGVHLSRLAEEIVLWTSAEFGFARLADEWSTGSSMMPQKKNPDMAELIRGRAARTIGDLTGLLGVLKGLPLAYDRDLQEDKEALFSSVARTLGCLQGMIGLLRSLRFDVERMNAAAAAGATWATDLAEKLVARGVPFRVAHEATASLVSELEISGASLGEITGDDLARHHPAFEADDVSAADPAVGMSARSSHGATAPDRVLEQLTALAQRAELVTRG
jgi:argininosuccinate lyase